MSELKFTTADFYDAATGETHQITVDEYDPDLHEGCIQCPASECSAALSFVSAHLADASNEDRPDHFRTNYHGEPHTENCPLDPELDQKRILRMKDALSEGRIILLNVNFSTSFDKERGRLPKRFADEAMAKIDGKYRPTWIKEHKDGYAPFSAADVEKIAKRVREFRAASVEVLGDVDHSKMVVSYLHGAIPWSSFYSADPTNDLTIRTPQTTSPQTIFEDLYSEVKPSQTTYNLWRPAPVSRMQLKPQKNAQWGNKVPTNTLGHNNTVTIDDKEFKLQDVLVVTDRTLLPKIRNASTVSIVATPFITPKDIEAQVERGSDFVHLNWAIGSEDQVILAND